MESFSSEEKIAVGVALVVVAVLFAVFFPALRAETSANEGVSIDMRSSLVNPDGDHLSR